MHEQVHCSTAAFVMLFVAGWGNSHRGLIRVVLTRHSASPARQKLLYVSRSVPRELTNVSVALVTPIAAGDTVRQHRKPQPQP